MSEELRESISGDVTVWLTNKRAKKSAVIRWDEKWWLTMNDGVREFADLLDAVKAAYDLMEKPGRPSWDMPKTKGQ